jgi:branched-chain amino acid transport system ATP-binding protein
MSLAVPLLKVRNASKAFGGLVAVNNVSFSVATGELLGLIGPNGSGKTTLLNLISGALQVTSGRIALSGRTISSLPAHRIAHQGVARTFQLVRVLPSLSAAENVIAGAAFSGERIWGADAYELAHELLERVGLHGKDGIPTAAMSYIDQKRVELARALASDPKLLLLDEWLAGLNPTELRTGIRLIDELRQEGRTIIMVEHVMDAIRELCDRCVVMNGGKLIAEGVVSEVLANPEVVRAYLGDEHA